MNKKYDDWINNSQKYVDALESALEKHGGIDVIADYTDVAFAFPSNNANPHSFDYPLIDQNKFIEWAQLKGWKVQLAPELVSEEDKHRPPVRFAKK